MPCVDGYRLAVNVDLVVLVPLVPISFAQNVEVQTSRREGMIPQLVLKVA